jgi:hypothetical protein
MAYFFVIQLRKVIYNSSDFFEILHFDVILLGLSGKIGIFFIVKSNSLFLSEKETSIPSLK